MINWIKDKWSLYKLWVADFVFALGFFALIIFIFSMLILSE